jgi:hypothetical protein
MTWGVPKDSPCLCLTPSNTLDNPMEPENHHSTVITLNLTLKPDRMPLFSHLLGQGFIIDTRTGISVRELLCRQIGVSDAYLDRRVQTIFLNGKVVDDVDNAVIRNGDVLALSAAMPGLAGATLRRGGFYAAMRKEISHHNKTSNDSPGNGSVTIKLFNFLALELGAIFLEQGIRINGKQMNFFFQNVPEFFWDGCHFAKIDGRPLDRDKIAILELELQQVFLKLKFKE